MAILCSLTIFMEVPDWHQLLFEAKYGGGTKTFWVGFHGNMVGIWWVIVITFYKYSGKH